MAWVIHKAKIVRPTTCMEKEASDFRCFVVGLPFSMTPDDIKMGKLRCVCRLRSTLSLPLYFSISAVDIFHCRNTTIHILNLTLQHLWRKRGKKVDFSLCGITYNKYWKKVFFSREIANLRLKEYKISLKLVYFRENILEYYLIRQLHIAFTWVYSYKSV